jgi:hypothetical protein
MCNDDVVANFKLLYPHILLKEINKNVKVYVSHHCNAARERLVFTETFQCGRHMYSRKVSQLKPINIFAPYTLR